MKVLRVGNQTIICPNCASLLEYEWTDIHNENASHNSYEYSYVICPICANNIEVDREIQIPDLPLANDDFTTFDRTNWLNTTCSSCYDTNKVVSNDINSGIVTITGSANAIKLSTTLEDN